MKSNDKFKKPKRAFTARYTAPSRRLREVYSTFVHKDKFCIGKIDSNCLNKKRRAKNGNIWYNNSMATFR